MIFLIMLGKTRIMKARITRAICNFSIILKQQCLKRYSFVIVIISNILNNVTLENKCNDLRILPIFLYALMYILCFL